MTTLVSSGSTTLKVNFENKKMEKRVFSNPFINKYIPSLKFPDKGNFDAAVYFSGQQLFFNFSDYPQVEVGVGDMSEKDIISIIELLFERSRQEKGIYCIHSASAIFQQKAIVFWGGASGMGKTRLVRMLSDKGGEFYSDEKTLIDLKSMEVVGSIPYLYLSKNYWKKQLYKMNSDSYYKKKVSFTEVAPLALFVYGFAIDGAEFSCERWPEEKFEWHMYEELGRKIRAISRRVENGKISVPSLDSQENADKRIANIQKLSKLIPCYSIQGTPEDIIRYIEKLKWK